MPSAVPTIDDVPWPRAMRELVSSLLRILATTDHRPERIEVLFGDGAMEMLGRDLLRHLTSVEAFESVPVEFPERPGPTPLVIELRALARTGGAQAGVHAELVVASAGI